MKRREVLKSLSLLAAINFSALSFARPSQPRRPKFIPLTTDTLLAQSGVYGQGVFVVGVLRCSNPRGVDKRLEDLRETTKFRLTLSHHSKSKYKVPYFESVVGDWLAHDDVKIYLRVLMPKQPPNTNPTAAQLLSNYVGDLTSALAMGSGITSTQDRIITVQRYKDPQQASLDSMMLARNPWARSVEKIRAEQCNLLQLLNAVTGMVRANEEPLERSANRNHSKLTCMTKLRAAVNVNDFHHSTKSKGFEVAVA